jgi:uncharacterized membrane protein (UPF0127 family)
VKDGAVLASLEVAGSRAARARGLLGRDSLDGVLLLDGVRSVLTFGMRFPIDVLFCDGEGRVLHVATLRRHRVTRPVWRAARALEAEAGSFARWGVAVGDLIELR